MKITMEGKYAYRQDPTTEVRVICIDLPGDYPIVSVDSYNDLHTHTKNGAYDYDDLGRDRDLVPLQAKPREVWLWEYRNGSLSSLIFDKEAEAIRTINYSGRPIRFVEQEPDQ